MSFYLPTLAQGSIAKLDEKNGFKDAKLESNVSSFGHLVDEYCGSSEAGVKCYTRTTDVLKVGTASLDKIQYTFYKDALAVITVTVKGRENIISFSETLYAAYGTGKRPYEGVNEAEWNGERVKMSAEVKKEEGSKEPVLTLTIVSKPQIARSKMDRVENRKAAMQKAISDL
ncbi:hypothetical protein MUN84_08325 [Hymenobacter sp. 5516J-16]|uniref:hypothetical protein n=1 Tax=Hymenobacter sp. 5516J-16 TaxID=2932253 RepID=UPI001FD1C0FA|nr:hypothetical protein [Hymenobacter sp. 5516J-16]UOQ78543.1 hypothetical protein MUN84_08325 [Hymenobacter sp. 5516J-16]